MTAPVPWAGAPWTPRAWQVQAVIAAITAMRARRRELIAAIMGSGKSVVLAELAWLAQPRLAGRIVVVVVPRQALVLQLYATFTARLGDGAVGQWYADQHDAGRDVVICCAGSLQSLREELDAQGRRVALLVVDEAHGSQAEGLRRELPLLEAAATVGCTATPFRSLPREMLELWDGVCYRYDIEQALEDGVLVPFRAVLAPARCPADQEILRGIVEETEGPGIVSARSIADAEEHAEWLSEEGVRAAPIHSRLGRDARADLLARLRSGALRALVHVALLAEGVDLPWLRWIGMRRPVRARVRFVQELGRVLRCAPGKSEAVVLDPHGLLGMHGLDHAEALGEVLRQEAAVGEPGAGTGGPGAMPDAVAVRALIDVMIGCWLGLREHEVIDWRAPPGAWGGRRISAKQAEAIKRAGRWRACAPAPYRDALGELSKRPWLLTRGQASMMMDVLLSGMQWGRAQAAGRGGYLNAHKWPAGWVELEDVGTLEIAMGAVKRLDRQRYVDGMHGQR